METAKQQLRNIIRESEDTTLDYISGVLFRYGVNFDTITSDDGEEALKLMFNDNTISSFDEIVSFLDKMGYKEVEFNDNAHIFVKKPLSTINEQKIASLICESLEKKDVIDMFRKDKDFEKKVREIAADVVTELFRVLWQHNGLFKNLAKK